MAKDKFNFSSPLHLACAEDGYRPDMECVHFIDGYAYASNAHVLVKQSLSKYNSVIDMERLDGHRLHRDSYENIRKFDMAKATPEGVECWDEEGKKAFFPYADNPERRAPDMAAVIKEKPAVEIACIGVNPRYIEVAAKCLAREKNTPLKLSFHGHNSMIEITAEGYGYQLAVVMPVILGGNLF